jgi:voltage-dependent potassium channel beta subunit
VKYRRLGDSGLKVSAVALGTWLTFGGRLEDREAGPILARAFELGINFIDTADVYETGRAEAQLGRLLKGIPRKDYVLASKVYFPTGDGPNDQGLSRKHIDETLHASLERLQTTYLDLFQCHRYDPDTPLVETVRAMDDMIRQGRILYWGVSMWTASQITDAVEIARSLNAAPPISNQPVYNLMSREIEKEVLPASRRLGVGTIPFSPLAQGVLTGKYQGGTRPGDSRAADQRRNRFMGRYLEDAQLARVARMAEIAGTLDVTPAQLALAWLLHRDGIDSVIVGATKVRQLDENAAAADVALSGDVVAELDALFPAAG